MESDTDILEIITVIAANKKWKKWYEKNREHFFDLVNKHKKNRRGEFKELIEERKDVPCMSCGDKFHPAAMDFIHRDGEDKKFSISDASRKIYSKEKLIEEMDKCDIICSNCQKIKKMEQFLKDSKGNEKKKRRRQKLLEAINSVKTKPCLECKKTFPPYCMELDHTGKGIKDKVDSVAKMVNQERPTEMIVKELKKVESICGNCHRKRTYERAHKK